MSHPKRKDYFTAWAKAMVEGATVDKPNYSPVKRASKGRAQPKKQQRRSRRKKRNKDG
jgi:hypothetical protein